MSELPTKAKVRLDKWLWAARFFRTRSLAQKEIEAGHVRHDGNRVKVSKEIQQGARLTIRQGYDEMEVVVLGLSEQRGGAPVARLLYEETAESQSRREQAAALRRAANAVGGDTRPTKKQRRDIHRFKQQWSD